MDAVYIPQLTKLTDKTCLIDVDHYLPGLDTLTPVRGAVVVTHGGTYIDVSGEAEAIVTLACDRCLEHYNYRIRVNPHELIWLQSDPLDGAAFPAEREVSVEDLVETLPPDGYFDPFTWLYEQLCLALPQPQLCSVDCIGLPVEGQAQEHRSEDNDSPDRRWAALTQLKRQLDDLSS